MKIYVLHYYLLTERRIHLESEIDRHKFTDVEWIINYSNDEYTKDKLKYFTPTLPPKIHALSLMHFNVYRSMINNNIQNALIFEDDVILCDDFQAKLDKYMTQLPNGWDFVFIGDGCKLHIKKTEANKYIYPHHLSRCTDSYLISLKAAKSIINYVDQVMQGYKPIIHTAIDHWMNFIFKELNMSVYWAEPTLITQGSQNGKFKSELGNPRFF
jgi:glycosyl transferase family 25